MVELVADSEEGGFTARLPDVPAYGEGDDLREALKGYIETFGLEDVMSRIVVPHLRPAGWDLKELVHA